MKFDTALSRNNLRNASSITYPFTYTLKMNHIIISTHNDLIFPARVVILLTILFCSVSYCNLTSDTRAWPGGFQVCIYKGLK